VRFRRLLQKVEQFTGDSVLHLIESIIDEIEVFRSEPEFLFFVETNNLIVGIFEIFIRGETGFLDVFDLFVLHIVVHALEFTHHGSIC